ncbi:MAG: hypothetical protein COX77_01280 [Candidatus Komeilibacteria bacterium CG_4_10_14_0_2_um_filter_37_10]|uniref:RNA polymerase sigma factor 70 region 4 type 2 domain-containing protein n=1 Tax=Candidatus Komeilibacteria bacterium CG_4_10_14_0_2_um_filter_37_10 TaxID=1974470 RepID=A0A2M7VFU7_9BACT|nr:MAG: hypothetical protein COX77_01280 [Candidatus Komeilibacteria bacterium CG_4_10_14_0_2_um_filter_37_10]
METTKSTEELWKDFNNTHDLELKKQLVINYLSIIYEVVNSMTWLKDGVADLDIVRFGVEALSETIDRFTSETGDGFELYAKHRIKCQIIDQLKIIFLNPLSIARGDGPAHLLPIEQYRLINKVISPTTDPITNPEQIVILDTIALFNKEERLIFILYYYEGLTHREISTVLNLTITQVKKVYCDLLSKIEKSLTTAKI